MFKPVVSVIIPFYSNVEGRLIKAVASALTQTIKNIEIIVVDDCSPVSAVNELRSCPDQRVVIVKHKKNTNGGIARNTGIVAAKGEFIAFLDYDDIWYSDKLEKQLNLFKLTDNQNKKTVIYSRCNIVDGEQHFIKPIRSIGINEQVGNYLFVAREIIQTSGIFLSADIAKTVKFDDLKRHQDYQFCLALEKFGCTFIMLEEPSYDFVQVPKLNDYKFSISWLETYSADLNAKSIKGFKKLVVIRSMVSHLHYIQAIIYSWQHNIFVDLLIVLVISLLKKLFPKKLILFLKYSLKLGK